MIKSDRDVKSVSVVSARSRAEVNMVTKGKDTFK